MQKRAGQKQAGVRLLASAGLAGLLMLTLPSDGEAAVFVLENGQRIEGEIIHSTRNTIMLRGTVGGVRQLSRTEIDAVQISLADGRTISGSLESWRGGLYEVRQANIVLSVQDGRVIAEKQFAGGPTDEVQITGIAGIQDQGVSQAQSDKDVAAQVDTQAEGNGAQDLAGQEETATAVESAGADAAADADTLVQGEASSTEDQLMSDQVASPEAEDLKEASQIDKSAVAVEEESEIAGLSDTGNGNGDGEFEETVVATKGEPSEDVGNQEVAAVPAAVQTTVSQDLPVLSILEGKATAGEADVVFKVELSAPSDFEVLVIYATFDGTAKAGTHYKEAVGTVTLRPGQTETTLKVPLLDGLSLEQNETFEVFITTESDLAKIKSKRATGTILRDGG
ncbi:MAG: Calx-beta domain-containing protein [Pseudomonadota bacterium]